MTACSSILALGMMPLCLLVYTTVWTSSDAIQIPYDSIGKTASNNLMRRLKKWKDFSFYVFVWSCILIGLMFFSGITLVSLLVPVALGIYVKHRWPKAAKKILKVCFCFWVYCRKFLCMPCCFTLYVSVHIGRIRGGNLPHHHHCSYRWCAISVLMDHFSFALDHRYHLSIYRLWAGLSLGTLCGTTLVQVKICKFCLPMKH